MKKAIAKRNCFFHGALKKIRTPDLLVRSQTLYPAELRAHIHFIVSEVFVPQQRN